MKVTIKYNEKSPMPGYKETINDVWAVDKEIRTEDNGKIQFNELIIKIWGFNDFDKWVLIRTGYRIDWIKEIKIKMEKEDININTYND